MHLSVIVAQEEEEKEQEEREKEFQRQRRLQGSGLDVEGGVTTYANQAFGTEVTEGIASSVNNQSMQQNQQESLEKF